MREDKFYAYLGQIPLYIRERDVTFNMILTLLK